jgi:hypothetical protein
MSSAGCFDSVFSRDRLRWCYGPNSAWLEGKASDYMQQSAPYIRAGEFRFAGAASSSGTQALATGPVRTSLRPLVFAQRDVSGLTMDGIRQCCER